MAGLPRCADCGAGILNLEEIAATLNLFPEVEWDRCVSHLADESPSFCAYGWIEREDGRSDFLTLDFYPAVEGWPSHRGMMIGSTTSSSRYSQSITERLFGPGAAHFDCQRIEDVFGDLVERKIEL